MSRTLKLQISRDVAASLLYLASHDKTALAVFSEQLPAETRRELERLLRRFEKLTRTDGGMKPMATRGKTTSTRRKTSTRQADTGSERTSGKTAKRGRTAKKSSGKASGSRSKKATRSAGSSRSTRARSTRRTSGANRTIRSMRSNGAERKIMSASELRQWREHRQFSQLEAAERLCLAAPTYRAFERSQRKVPPYIAELVRSVDVVDKTPMTAR